MPVRAMRVEFKKIHPNADTLWVYDFSIEGETLIQVIANSETVYEKDDIVAVALHGAILKDGTEIKKTKLRGMASYGMAMGKVEAAEGDDLTSEYCHPSYSPDTQVRHVKWPAIELFHNVLRALEGVKEYREEYEPPVVNYLAKTKLHGTNAAVQIAGGKIVAQSRKCVLTPEVGDNKGFRAWVEKGRDYWEQYLDSPVPLTFFGEWCGPGVQRGMAVSKLDRRVFAVFGVQVDFDSAAILLTRPDEIFALCRGLHADMYILPWYNDVFLKIDFGDEKSLETAVACMNHNVEKVETEDPWVKSQFGISGMGEGLVWYPHGNGSELPWYLPFHEMMFKTKGEKHAVVQQKKPAVLSAEVVESIEEFVGKFVTAPRFEQILEEVVGDETPTKRDTGRFMKAFNADVLKESKAELEAAGLEWKQVAKAVGDAARGLFFLRVAP